jgi:hypothetical protein
MGGFRMKLLTKQQALKAYLSGYTIVYNIEGKFKQVNQNTRLSTSNEYYVLGC